MKALNSCKIQELITYYGETKMDKVFSTRLDERLINQINIFVKDKSISKKRLVEMALKNYFEQAGSKIEYDIIERSFGLWERNEKANNTWSHARKTFNEGFRRHIEEE
jgi:hypothetical protein